VNRLNTYPVSKEAKEEELNTMKNIQHNNNYNINRVIKYPAPQEQDTDMDTQHRETKWATFIYSRKGTIKITKLFKDTRIKISFKTNTIQNIIKHHPRTDKCNKSGIYQMKYLDFPLKYLEMIDTSSNPYR
jgi:hypothetical protein